MVTVDQLRRADIGALKGHAQDWRNAATELGTDKDDHVGCTQRISGFWTGDSANAAKDAFQKNDVHLSESSDRAARVAVVLDEAAENIHAAKTKLEAALAHANSENLKVRDDGYVSWDPPPVMPPTREMLDKYQADREAAALAVSGEIKAALEAAAKADDDAVKAMAAVC
jgi:uncharacterized protein YukE